MKQHKIIKTNGEIEDYNPEKFHSKVKFATEGVRNVSASEIEVRAAASILDGVTSRDVQNALINAAKDLILEHDNYQIVAARLLNQAIRKEVYGDFNPRPLVESIELNKRVYDYEYLYTYYTKEEINEFNKLIDYSRDDLFVYAGIRQMADAYLTKRNDKWVETPQDTFMLISLFGFAKYEPKARWKLVKNLYDALSTFEISLPTPTMIQLRTRYAKYFSCNIVPIGDTKKTIANAAKSVYEIVADGAGLGLDSTLIRGFNADIDGGRMKHTGSLPIIKSFQGDTKAFKQPSRTGASTVYKNFFHTEIQSFLVWGNNKGTDETRARDVDYAIVFNELFFERMKAKEDISLFYMNDVPGLSAIMGDNKAFKELYEKYEKTVPKSKQTRVNPKKIWDLFINERFLQARVYACFAENMSGRSSFDIPIKTSNLCVKGDTKINIKKDGIIEEINIEDLGKYINQKVEVLSRNLETKKDEYKEILDFALMNDNAEILRITDESSGNFIECTEDHKIWTENRGYIEAGKLVEDDIVKIK